MQEASQLVQAQMQMMAQAVDEEDSTKPDSKAAVEEESRNPESGPAVSPKELDDRDRERLAQELIDEEAAEKENLPKKKRNSASGQGKKR